MVLSDQECVQSLTFFMHALSSACDIRFVIWHYWTGCEEGCLELSQILGFHRISIEGLGSQSEARAGVLLRLLNRLSLHRAFSSLENACEGQVEVAHALSLVRNTCPIAASSASR